MGDHETGSSVINLKGRYIVFGTNAYEARGGMLDAVLQGDDLELIRDAIIEAQHTTGYRATLIPEGLTQLQPQHGPEMAHYDSYDIYDRLADEEVEL